MRRIALIAIATSLIAATCLDENLFQTKFENSAYTPGLPLDGQDGWTALLSPDAAIITSGARTAASGRHAVGCWGGGPLEDVGGGLLDGAWEQVIDHDPITCPEQVRVEADVRLDGPSTNQGNGPGDDFVSANLYARNGGGRSAFMFLSSNGNAYAFANSDQGSAGYRFGTPVHAGYNHLAITLNYATHMATFEVNGAVTGSLPFGGAGEQWRGVLLEFGAFDDPQFVNVEDYTGYWDNLKVRAKPAH